MYRAFLVADSKESACNAGDLGLIPGSGRSPGGGNGNPLQYSCLGNLVDRGAWWAPVHGVGKSCTQLSNTACIHTQSYTPLLQGPARALPCCHL